MTTMYETEKVFMIARLDFGGWAEVRTWDYSSFEVWQVMQWGNKRQQRRVATYDDYLLAREAADEAREHIVAWWEKTNPPDA